MPNGQPNSIFAAMEFPDYSFKPFPQMLYAPGRQTIVQDKEQLARLEGTWWLLPNCEGEPYVNTVAAPAPTSAD